MVPEPVVPQQQDLAGLAAMGVYELSAAMERDLETFEIPVEHIFLPGLYARKVTIPAGALVTAKLYREDHLCVCATGRVRVATLLNGKRQDVVERQAGDSYASPAGSQRVGFFLEETIWVTVHPNPENLTDVDALEARIYAPVPDLASLAVDHIPQLTVLRGLEA